MRCFFVSNTDCTWHLVCVLKFVRFVRSFASFHLFNGFFFTLFVTRGVFLKSSPEFKLHLFTRIDWFGVDICNGANFHLKIAQTISIIRVITKSVHTAKLRNGNPLYRPQTNVNKYTQRNETERRRNQKQRKITVQIAEKNKQTKKRMTKWNREHAPVYTHTQKLNRKLIIGALFLARLRYRLNVISGKLMSFSSLFVRFTCVEYNFARNYNFRLTATAAREMPPQSVDYFFSTLGTRTWSVVFVVFVALFRSKLSFFTSIVRF